MDPTKDEGATTPDASSDIESILTGTSDTETTGGANDGTKAGQGAEFVFGGRKYPDQRAAEKSHNDLYGKFSKQQEFVNKLKALAQRDPKAFAELSGDGEWGDILAKLGIQRAEENLSREEGSEQEPTVEGLMEEVRIERATMALEREEAAFERRLGRQLTDKEHDAAVRAISTAPSLTFEQAFKLAHHDTLLAEATKKAEAAAAAKAPKKRPPPGALNIPGVKIDTKKKPEDMTEAEWRQSLRESPEFQNLMSRE